MFGKRRYVYLVDGLTDERAAVMRNSLGIVGEIATVQIAASRSMIEVEASRDVEDQIRVACDVAGVHFRTRIRR
jgi:hypothetical protein